MPCYIETDDKGNRIHICGKLGPHCSDCLGVGENLCDYPVGAGKTCDRIVCKNHSKEIAPNMHYCSAHIEAWQEFVRSGGAKDVLENVVPYSRR